jgi:hypothetical protein
MSISKDEFEKGKKKDPLEEKIVDFLKKNKDEAFTGTEIAESIGIKVIDVNEDWITSFFEILKDNLPSGVMFSFYRVLDGLVRENKIIKGKIDSEDYYSI